MTERRLTYPRRQFLLYAILPVLALILCLFLALLHSVHAL